MNKFAALLIIVFLSGCASQQQQQQPPQPPQPPTPPSSPSPPQPQPPPPEEGKKGEESSEDSEQGQEQGEQSEQEGQEQEGQEQEGQEQEGQEGQEQEGGLELPEVGGEESEDGDEEDSDSTSDNKDCGGIILIGDVGGMGDTGACSENPTESTNEEEESEEESGGGATSEEEESSEESGGGAVVSEGESGGSAGEVGQYPEESREDRMERISKELDKSIGDFDEILMEEQREISSVGRNMEGFGDGEARQAGKIGLGEQEGGPTSGGTISILNPDEGQGRAASIEGLSKEDIQTRVPEDIIPIDDDVIAKQLYEAAVSEDDPELRERLWEEYRKYKRY